MTITIFIVALALLMDPSASIAQDPQGGNEPTPTPQEGETGSLGEENDPTVLAPENATALVSSSFTYQGQLRHEGKAVNGNCDFTWNIFATNVITTPLATDSDTNVPVKNGLFFATINVPTSVIDGNARFLEILVRCPTGEGAYTALSPRQELQAAPYALGLRMPFSHTFSDAMTTNPIFAVSNINTSTSQPSIQGTSAGGNGVSGVSTGGSYADNGVYGETNSTDTAEAGVKGRSTGSAAGGYFSSTNGHGVYGKTDSPTQFGGYFYNSASSTSGGALFAAGDAKQSLSGNGLIKAAAWAMCSDGAPAASINASFNNVNTQAISIIAGHSNGQCRIDFGFDVSNRYIMVVANSALPVIVTFTWDAVNNNLVYFWHHTIAGVGEDGLIMVMVY